MKKWKTLKSETVYKTYTRNLKKDIIMFPDNRESEYTYFDGEDSVMVIGLKDGKLLMIRQYRYMSDNVELEFSSGYLEKGETPEEGAKREFEEETGYKAKKIQFLCDFYENIGYCRNKMHVFVVTEMEKTEQRLDKGEKGFEDIAVEEMTIEEMRKLITGNKLTSCSTIAGFMLLDEKIKNGEVKI